jgi:ABC-type phosphate transport system auxiliary subunit
MAWKRQYPQLFATTNTALWLLYNYGSRELKGQVFFWSLQVEIQPRPLPWRQSKLEVKAKTQVCQYWLLITTSNRK